MAQVSSLYVCPRCEEGISAIKQIVSCPSCGLPLGKQTQAPYTPPYTLTEQHQKYQDTKQYVQALQDLRIEKANSIMNDALSLIEIVAGKNTPIADIRNLIEMAIRIGDIAKAYDAFLIAGGKHIPSFYIKQTSPGESNELKNAKSSGVTPPGPTNPPSPLLAEMPRGGN